MKTVANVLMPIHISIFALANGSGAIWSFVMMFGVWASGPSTPSFSRSLAFPFLSSSSVSDMLSSVRSDDRESLRDSGLPAVNLSVLSLNFSVTASIADS